MERRPDDRGPEDDRGRIEDEAEGRRLAERAQRGRMAKIILGLILLILLVVFVVQNSAEVPVRLIFTDARVPLILVLLSTAVAGAVITLLLGWPYRRTLRKYIRELERERGGDERGRRQR